MNREAFPMTIPLALGMPGMHGNYTAVTAIQESDLLITLGARFDDRVTGKVDAFAPDAKVIHADIDPAEFNKVRSADVSIQGDVGQTITELIKALKELSGTQDHLIDQRGSHRSVDGKNVSHWYMTSGNKEKVSNLNMSLNNFVTIHPMTQSSPQELGNIKCGPVNSGNSIIHTHGLTLEV